MSNRSSHRCTILVSGVGNQGRRKSFQGEFVGVSGSVTNFLVRTIPYSLLLLFWTHPSVCVALKLPSPPLARQLRNSKSRFFLLPLSLCGRRSHRYVEKEQLSPRGLNDDSPYLRDDFAVSPSFVHASRRPRQTSSRYTSRFRQSSRSTLTRYPCRPQRRSIERRRTRCSACREVTSCQARGVHARGCSTT
jgi:hypothetical protein